eukprot:scaffold17268_cov89-Isochrysis_galbana.AAC.1
MQAESEQPRSRASPSSIKRRLERSPGEAQLPPVPRMISPPVYHAASLSPGSLHIAVGWDATQQGRKGPGELRGHRRQVGRHECQQVRHPPVQLRRLGLVVLRRVQSHVGHNGGPLLGDKERPLDIVRLDERDQALDLEQLQFQLDTLRHLL